MFSDNGMWGVWLMGVLEMAPMSADASVTFDLKTLSLYCNRRKFPLETKWEMKKFLPSLGFTLENNC